MMARKKFDFSHFEKYNLLILPAVNSHFLAFYEFIKDAGI